MQKPSFGTISRIFERRGGRVKNWIFSLIMQHLILIRKFGTKNHITVSQRAIKRSFSNLAYSRRSWITVSSFQISKSTSPISTIPAMTPKTMAKMGSGGGQSEDYRLIFIDFSDFI